MKTISNCDGCNEPQGEIKSRFAYGCEGDFCHTCRHGKDCDCEEAGQGIMASDKCYYDNELCDGELWLCQSCGESFCHTHWHETDLGYKVECVACEHERKKRV